MGLRAMMKEPEMDVGSTVRHSTWYRTPFGRRLMSAEFPYFRIAPASEREHTDTLRRQALADLAGLGH